MLDRVPAEAVEPVTRDLERLLVENGFDGTRLFTVPEAALPSEKARPPAELVSPISAWLSELAADAAERSRVVRQTLSGRSTAWSRGCRCWPTPSRGSRPGSTAAVHRSGAYAAGWPTSTRACATVAAARRGAGPLAGLHRHRRPDARWRAGSARLRRPYRRVLHRQATAASLRDALESGVETLIRGAADGAGRAQPGGLVGRSGGPGIIARVGAVDAGPASQPARPGQAASAAVRGWQEYARPRTPRGRREATTARIASFGVNGAGLLLMLAVFASTVGSTASR